MNGHTPLALAFDDDHRELRRHFPSLVVKSTNDATRRCALCGGGGGALLPTAEGAWAHGVCALYLPGVHLASDVEGGGLCAHGVPAALARPPLRAPPPPPDAAEAEAAAAADAAAALHAENPAHVAAGRAARPARARGLGDRLGRRRGRRRRRGGGALQAVQAHDVGRRDAAAARRVDVTATASSPSRLARPRGRRRRRPRPAATADVCAMCGGGGGSWAAPPPAAPAAAPVVRARRRRAPRLVRPLRVRALLHSVRRPFRRRQRQPPALGRAGGAAKWSRPNDAARRAAAARQGPARHVDAAVRSIARDQTVQNRAAVREADTTAAAGDEPAASVVGQGRARRRRPQLRPAARSAHLV